MFEQAQALDRDLVRLEVGDPDFDTPAHIVEAACAATKDGATHYTSNAGIGELREAIADKLRRDNGLEVDPEEQVVVTCGAMEALYLTLMSVVDSDDEVVLPSPTYPNYFAMVTMMNATPVEVALPAERGFELDAKQVSAAITDQTAAVILNSPCNPTGTVFERDAVRTVVETAVDHEALVIADEVYEGIMYDQDPKSIAAFTEYPHHVVSINSCSKKYAMTGWRLGWLAGPPEITQAARRLHQGTTSCAPTVSQHAALAALTGNQTPIDQMVETFERRRNTLIERLEAIPEITATKPEGAFYTFVDVSPLGQSSIEIAERFMKDYGVVTTPGVAFGEAGEGYLRISFANDMKSIETGCDRLEEMVADS